MQNLTIDPSIKQPPTRDLSRSQDIPPELKPAKTSHVHPTKPTKDGNGRIFFVGTATTILEWEGIRLMTDPNFLHAGDHVHLGPGVTGTRQTNPAVDLHELPHIDLVLLSHYHADHFDQHVEASLRRDLPIITTPHAKQHLANKDPVNESFTNVHALDVWDAMTVTVDQRSAPQPQLRVTGMPGKHIPDSGLVATLNDLVAAIPPTNGWMLELGYQVNTNTNTSSDLSTTTKTEAETGTFHCSYRIYISGDTLLVDDLKQIPARYNADSGSPVDLMLVHLGGTTIPGPSAPLLMVTMDARQGLELIKLVRPDLTVPIHYDDYDVFLSPLSDFEREVREAGLQDKVVYLDRGDELRFDVKKIGPE